MVTEHRSNKSFIHLSDIGKTFGGFTALHPLILDIAPGEFHALIGENGAGKSTLINVITGVYRPTSGSIEVGGKVINHMTPIKASLMGIYAVHQELSLCPHLTIAENLFLGRELTGSLGMLRKGDIRKKAMELLQEVELSHLHPDQQVRHLTLAEQQLIEFMKAIHQKPSLLILDEATSALDPNQVEIMFNKLNQLRSDGMSVIFISHRLQELYDLCHTMTVLKDGKQIITDSIDKYNQDDLIRLMTGRELLDIFPTKPSAMKIRKQKKVLTAEGLQTNKIHHINFDLHEGEILGIGGLQGQGQEEVLKALFGIVKVTSGHIKLDGKNIRFKNTRQAMRHGVAYLPSDRKSQSLLLPHSIRFNSTLSNLKHVSGLTGTINKKYEKEIVRKSMDNMQVKAQSMEQHVESLSGGNQQKIAIIKWLQRNPRILLLNEPTRGIDVGTKKEIYELLRTLVQKGISIILISSDALELIGLCDRVITLYEFQLNGELQGDELTEENLVRASVIKGGRKIDELVKTSIL